MPSEAAAIADLVQALRDEGAARNGVRAALRREAAALDELRRMGLQSSTIAHRVSKALGLPLSLRERRRLADSLRQRRSRLRRGRTERHGRLVGAPISGEGADLESPRAISPPTEEMTMSRIVKRTVTTTTEEFLDDPTMEDEVRDGEETQDEDLDSNVEDEAPRRRSNGR